MASPWKWRQYGQCGQWVSDLVPHLATCVDDMAFLPAMVAKSNVHGPATFMQNTGFVLPGFPEHGSLGLVRPGKPEPEPAHVRRPSRLARVRPQRAGELDARVFCRPRIRERWSGPAPGTRSSTCSRPRMPGLTPEAQSDGLELLNRLNRAHEAERAGDSRLDARIASYELAARLATQCARGARPLARDPATTRSLYGLDDPVTEDFGRNCLIARRLLERGVRFVQVWSGADNGFPRRNWDSHEDIARDHGDMAASMDQPAAALIKDLKSRGLLDDTIVIWTTEFGRMPCSQGSKGRDHNPFTFTSWLAGGGIKGGVTYGASDEWSYKAVENDHLLLRPARHRSSPAWHRPHPAHVPPQRHRPPPDRCAWARHQRNSDLICPMHCIMWLSAHG